MLSVMERCRASSVLYLFVENLASNSATRINSSKQILLFNPIASQMISSMKMSHLFNCTSSLLQVIYTKNSKSSKLDTLIFLYVFRLKHCVPLQVLIYEQNQRCFSWDEGPHDYPFRQDSVTVISKEADSFWQKYAILDFSGFSRKFLSLASLLRCSHATTWRSDLWVDHVHPDSREWWILFDSSKTCPVRRSETFDIEGTYSRHVVSYL